MIPNCKQLQNKVTELEKENVYSTEEQVVGKWIDGKPLYRKVLNNISVEGKTATAPKYTYINNLPNSIDKIFIKYATVLVNTNNLLLPFISTDGGIIKINNITTEQIMITNETTYSGIGTLILEYTKTTD